MRLKIFIYSGPILPPSIGTEAAATAADKLRFPPKLLRVVKENSSKLFSNSSDLICPQRTINLKLNFLFLKKKCLEQSFEKTDLERRKKAQLIFPSCLFRCIFAFSIRPPSFCPAYFITFQSAPFERFYATLRRVLRGRMFVCLVADKHRPVETVHLDRQ